MAERTNEICSVGDRKPEEPFGCATNLDATLDVQSNCIEEKEEEEGIDSMTKEMKQGLVQRQLLKVGNKEEARRQMEEDELLSVPDLINEDEENPKKIGFKEEEEEEEEEIVTLEEEKTRLLPMTPASVGRVSMGHFAPAAPTPARRTPGANIMHRSAIVGNQQQQQQRAALLRRTPGATSMHRSMNGGAKGGSRGPLSSACGGPTPKGSKSSVLGFGLTLSTPVGATSSKGMSRCSFSSPPAAGDGDGNGDGRGCDGDEVSSEQLMESAYEASSSTNSESSSPPSHNTVTPLAAHGRKCFSQARRPPLNRGNGEAAGNERHYMYTPSSLSLSKNPHLNIVEGMDGTFSPNTIRLTESLDNLLHEDDNEDDTTQGEDWSKAYTFENGNSATLDATGKRHLQPAAVNADGSIERHLAEEAEAEDNASTNSSSTSNSKPRPLNFTDPGRRGGAFIPPSAIISNPTPKKPHPSSKTSQAHQKPASSSSAVHNSHYAAFPSHAPPPQQHAPCSSPRGTAPPPMAAASAAANAHVTNAELFPYHMHPHHPHHHPPTIPQYGYEHPYDPAALPLALYPPHGPTSPINLPNSSSTYPSPLPDHHHSHHYTPHPPQPMPHPFHPPAHHHHHPISSLSLPNNAHQPWQSHTPPQTISTENASLNQYANNNILSQRDGNAAGAWHGTHSTLNSNTGLPLPPPVVVSRNGVNTNATTWEQHHQLLDAYHDGPGVIDYDRNLHLPPPPQPILGHMSPTPILGHMPPPPLPNNNGNPHPPPSQHQWVDYNNDNSFMAMNATTNTTSSTTAPVGPYSIHHNHQYSTSMNGGRRESCYDDNDRLYSLGHSHMHADGHYNGMCINPTEHARESCNGPHHNHSHGEQPKRQHHQQGSQSQKERFGKTSCKQQQRELIDAVSSSLSFSSKQALVSSTKESSKNSISIQQQQRLHQQQQKFITDDMSSAQRSNFHSNHHRYHQTQQHSKQSNRKQRLANDQCTSSSSKSPLAQKNYNTAAAKTNIDNIRVSKTSPKKKSNSKKSLSNKKNVTDPITNSSPSSTSNQNKTDFALEEESTKRAELIESPATRLLFKEFSRKFRFKERMSLEKAQEFAIKCLHLQEENNDTDEDYVQLPRHIHWRVYLELADLAKRNNDFQHARTLYTKAINIQPYASQGWLEYSKLEEECGKLYKCASILHKGLSYCHNNEQQHNENLLTRAIKHEERMGNLSKARQLLGCLKSAKIEKVWRTVLEGALLEGRAGNAVIAKKVLKYLMHHVPWYGPLYLEAYRLEERHSSLTIACDGANDDDKNDDYSYYSPSALIIVERGLEEIPRYGPLWFAAFRMCEAIDVSKRDFDLPYTMAMMERATYCISRELLWKVHMEAAQVQERAAILAAVAAEKDYVDNYRDAGNSTLSFPTLNEKLSRCRRCFARTVLACPPNLCWKVWLAGGRMELIAGRVDVARKLFLRAYDVVPEKGRSAVLLECARLEEFDGDTELAQAILCKARHSGNSDWKVWIESVSIEMRNGKRERAIHLSRIAVAIHPCTGRLWASLIQLLQPDGEYSQHEALKSALRAVPKSGEVWCEGARIHLNPLVPTFDLNKASQHLSFATKFTPQYGDSFIEALRLELLNRWIVKIALPFINQLERHLLDDESSALDIGGIHALIGTYVRKAFFTILQAKYASEKEVSPGNGLAPKLNMNLSEESLPVLDLYGDYANVVDTSKIELRCSNADPNYGLLWFHCRKQSTDSARIILARAKKYVACDVFNFAHFYVSAMVRRAGVILAIRSEQETASNSSTITFEGNKEWDSLLEERLRTAPSLENFLQGSIEDQNAVTLLESDISGVDFITGLVGLNRHKELKSLSLIERRKVLFGSDSLLS
mmetsp:Transcript_15225/g.22390  ORF Transcript_15225/g.22390 Transcript_15225/m.22390 type:complete len:1864 (+) Transcript_15225:253-5844(+)